jgi:hypothetical protein
LKNKNSGHGSQGACRQDELIGGKPSALVRLSDSEMMIEESREGLEGWQFNYEKKILCVL